jgi:RNA polymerase sigma factor (sigma-70 family)
MQRSRPNLLAVPGLKRDSDVPPREPDPLAALTERVRAGDDQALTRLLQLLAPTLLRGVRAILGAVDADIEDVMQESLVALIAALPAFRGEGNLASYAQRIAVRAALLSRRRVRRQALRLSELEHAAPHAVNMVPLPVEEAMATRRKDLLRSLLDELPEVQAETLALRVVLGYSLGEVAEATGAPVNTVRSRLRLATEALRRRIEGDEGLSRELEVAG